MTETQFRPTPSGRSLLRRVRQAITAGLQRAEQIVNDRRQRGQRARTAGPAEVRQFSLELTAEHQLALPYMRQPYQEQWWEQATPERIGAAWEITASWAWLGEPYAEAALRHLRDQTAQLYGIAIDLSTPARDVVELLARAATSTLARRTDPGYATVSLAVRDTSRNTVIAHQLDLPLPPGIPPEQVAAEHLQRYVGTLAQINGQPADHLMTSRYQVELHHGPTITGPPVATVSADQARQVHQHILDWRAHVLAGTHIVPVSPAELRQALLAEQHRLELLITQHRDRAAEHTIPELAADQLTFAAQAEQELNYTRLRLHASDAEQRGENPAHVYQQAVLLERLTNEWWRDVSIDEMVSVWRYVTGWQDGQARQTMLARLQEGMYAAWGVVVLAGASADQVRDIVGPRIRERDDHAVAAMRARVRRSPSNGASTASPPSPGAAAPSSRMAEPQPGAAGQDSEVATPRAQQQPDPEPDPTASTPPRTAAHSSNGTSNADQAAPPASSNVLQQHGLQQHGQDDLNVRNDVIGDDLVVNGDGDDGTTSRNGEVAAQRIRLEPTKPPRSATRPSPAPQPHPVPAPPAPDVADDHSLLGDGGATPSQAAAASQTGQADGDHHVPAAANGQPQPGRHQQQAEQDGRQAATASTAATVNPAALMDLDTAEVLLSRGSYFMAELVLSRDDPATLSRLISGASAGAGVGGSLSSPTWRSFSVRRQGLRIEAGDAPNRRIHDLTWAQLHRWIQPGLRGDHAANLTKASTLSSRYRWLADTYTLMGESALHRAVLAELEAIGHTAQNGIIRDALAVHQPNLHLDPFPGETSSGRARLDELADAIAAVARHPTPVFDLQSGSVILAPGYQLSPMRVITVEEAADRYDIHGVLPDGRRVVHPWHKPSDPADTAPVTTLTLPRSLATLADPAAPAVPAVEPARAETAPASTAGAVPDTDPSGDRLATATAHHEQSEAAPSGSSDQADSLPPSSEQPASAGPGGEPASRSSTSVVPPADQRPTASAPSPANRAATVPRRFTAAEIGEQLKRFTATWFWQLVEAVQSPDPAQALDRFGRKTVGIGGLGGTVHHTRAGLRVEVNDANGQPVRREMLIKWADLADKWIRPALSNPRMVVLGRAETLYQHYRRGLEAFELLGQRPFQDQAIDELSAMAERARDDIVVAAIARNSAAATQQTLFEPDRHTPPAEPAPRSIDDAELPSLLHRLDELEAVVPKTWEESPPFDDLSLGDAVGTLDGHGLLILDEPPRRHDTHLELRGRLLQREWGTPVSEPHTLHLDADEVSVAVVRLPRLPNLAVDRQERESSPAEPHAEAAMDTGAQTAGLPAAEPALPAAVETPAPAPGQAAAEPTAGQELEALVAEHFGKKFLSGHPAAQRSAMRHVMPVARILLERALQHEGLQAARATMISDEVLASEDFTERILSFWVADQFRHPAETGIPASFANLFYEISAVQDAFIRKLHACVQQAAPVPPAPAEQDLPPGVLIPTPESTTNTILHGLYQAGIRYGVHHEQDGRVLVEVIRDGARLPPDVAAARYLPHLGIAPGEVTADDMARAMQRLGAPWVAQLVESITTPGAARPSQFRHASGRRLPHETDPGAVEDIEVSAGGLAVQVQTPGGARTGRWGWKRLGQLVSRGLTDTRTAILREGRALLQHVQDAQKNRPRDNDPVRNAAEELAQLLAAHTNRLFTDALQPEPLVPPTDGGPAEDAADTIDEATLTRIRHLAAELLPQVSPPPSEPGPPSSDAPKDTARQDDQESADDARVAPPAEPTEAAQPDSGGPGQDTQPQTAPPPAAPQRTGTGKARPARPHRAAAPAPMFIAHAYNAAGALAFTQSNEASAEAAQATAEHWAKVHNGSWEVIHASRAQFDHWARGDHSQPVQGMVVATGRPQTAEPKEVAPPAEPAAVPQQSASPGSPAASTSPPAPAPALEDPASQPEAGALFDPADVIVDRPDTATERSAPAEDGNHTSVGQPHTPAADAPPVAASEPADQPAAGDAADPLAPLRQRLRALAQSPRASASRNARVRARLETIADSPSLTVSPDGHLVVFQDGGAYGIATTHAGDDVVPNVLLKNRPESEVVELAHLVESQARDRDGRPFPWHAEIFREAVESWTSAEGLALRDAVVHIVANHDRTHERHDALAVVLDNERIWTAHHAREGRHRGPIKPDEIVRGDRLRIARPRAGRWDPEIIEGIAIRPPHRDSNGIVVDLRTVEGPTRPVHLTADDGILRMGDLWALPDSGPSPTAELSAHDAGTPTSQTPPAPAPAEPHAAADQENAVPSGTRGLAEDSPWGGPLRPERILHADDTPLTVRGQGEDGDQSRPAVASGALPAADADLAPGLHQVVRWSDGSYGIVAPALISRESIDPYAGMTPEQALRWLAFDRAEADGNPVAYLPADRVVVGDVIQVPRGPRSRTMDAHEVLEVAPNNPTLPGVITIVTRTGPRATKKRAYPRQGANTPFPAVGVFAPAQHPSLQATSGAAASESDRLQQVWHELHGCADPSQCAAPLGQEQADNLRYAMDIHTSLAEQDPGGGRFQLTWDSEAASIGVSWQRGRAAAWTMFVTTGAGVFPVFVGRRWADVSLGLNGAPPAGEVATRFYAALQTHAGLSPAGSQPEERPPAAGQEATTAAAGPSPAAAVDAESAESVSPDAENAAADPEAGASSAEQAGQVRQVRAEILLEGYVNLGAGYHYLSAYPDEAAGWPPHTNFSLGAHHDMRWLRDQADANGVAVVEGVHTATGETVTVEVDLNTVRVWPSQPSPAREDHRSNPAVDQAPARTSEPAATSTPDQSVPEVGAGDPKVGQGPPAPAGAWSNKITIVQEGHDLLVRGTDRGDPELLRAALKKNQFWWGRRPDAWLYMGSSANADHAVAQIRQALVTLDAEAAEETVSHPPTPQQQRIIDAILDDRQQVAVQALAGTGKTTVLRMLAARVAEAAPSKKILYLAFNSSIVNDAKGAFGPNVRVSTFHALARAGLVGGKYAAKLDAVGKGVQRPEEVAEVLGIPDEIIIGEDTVQGVTLARLAMQAVVKFRNSADPELDARHVPTFDTPPSELNRTVLHYAKHAWADITDPQGKLLFDHDDYQKIWALSRPRLHTDLIFFDEAQDISEVQADVVRRQPIQTIVVGDSRQSIYGFRGAVDALDRWPAEVVLPLTQSWRFGHAVATAGNRFLALLKSPFLLEGNPHRDSRLGPVPDPDAVLCRTNAGAVAAVIQGLDAGKRVAMVGGGRDLRAIAKAAGELMARRPTKHPELAGFKDWDEVREYVEEHPEERGLRTFVRLVDKHKPQGLISIIDQMVPEDTKDPEHKPELIVSTAHKAKGREWDHVLIADDFSGPTTNEDGTTNLPPAEDLRLAYVTVTRARVSLDIGSLEWILDDELLHEFNVAPELIAQLQPVEAAPATRPDQHRIQSAQPASQAEPAEAAQPEEGQNQAHESLRQVGRTVHQAVASDGLPADQRPGDALHRARRGDRSAGAGQDAGVGGAGPARGGLPRQDATHGSGPGQRAGDHSERDGVPAAGEGRDTGLVNGAATQPGADAIGPAGQPEGDAAIQSPGHEHQQLSAAVQDSGQPLIPQPGVFPAEIEPQITAAADAYRQALAGDNEGDMLAAWAALRDLIDQAADGHALGSPIYEEQRRLHRAGIVARDAWDATHQEVIRANRERRDRVTAALVEADRLTTAGELDNALAAVDDVARAYPDAGDWEQTRRQVRERWIDPTPLPSTDDGTPPSPPGMSPGRRRRLVEAIENHAASHAWTGDPGRYIADTYGEHHLTGEAGQQEKEWVDAYLAAHPEVFTFDDKERRRRFRQHERARAERRQQATELSSQAYELFTAGDAEGALALIERAEQLDPDGQGWEEIRGTIRETGVEVAGEPGSDGSQPESDVSPGAAEPAADQSGQVDPGQDTPSDNVTAGRPDADPAFRFAGQDDLAPSGEVARVRANLAALTALRRLQAEDRPATAEEQQVLARWSGWGAVPAVFDERDDKHERFAWARNQLRELLSPEDYDAAALNTLNAHYTDPAIAGPLWAAIQRLGFTGGQVLEPGCGAGTFIGLAPEKANMVGVELDPTTAAIARYLYPQARIFNESFADSRLPAGGFDLVIGNVPFGSISLVDERYNPKRRHRIHDHFLIKSMDMVKEGGLLAVITSAYTLDKLNPAARRELAAQADLVGAIRLPSTAHQRAAGTKALTDIVLLRRREEGKAPDPTAWERSPVITVDDTQVRLNEYFREHPEQVLGQLETGGLRREDELAVRLDEPLGPVLEQALARLVERAERDGLTWSSEPPQQQQPVKPVQEVRERPEGHLDVDDAGRFTIVEGGNAVPYKVPKTQVAELATAVRMRNTVQRLLEAQLETLDDTAEILELRERLNHLYDGYVTRYGPYNRFKLINSGHIDPETGEPKLRRQYPPVRQHLADDSWLMGLEIFDEETQTARKQEIFTQRVIGRNDPPLGVDRAEEALMVSFDQHGEIRMPYVAWLLGCDEDEARRMCGDLLFTDPATGQPETATLYLAGEVRKKLRAAKAAAEADPDFVRNVQALEKVIPEDWEPEQISVKLGEPWIPVEMMQDFLRDAFHDPNLTVRLEKKEEDTGWKVRPSRGSAVLEEEWGTERKKAVEIAVHALDQSTPIVYDTIQVGESTRRVPNHGQTALAREKVTELHQRFADWIWDDPTRSDDVAKQFNESFNGYVNPDYRRMQISFPGMSPAVQLYPHQVAGVARTLCEDTVGLAHATGAGKTRTMIAAAIKMKQLGIASKPAIIVPGNVIDEFERETRRVFPNANYLRGSARTLRGNRREFVAKCAEGNWDFVLLTYEAAARMPLREETLAEYTNDQVLGALNLDGLSVKKRQETIKNAREKVKQDLARQRDDGANLELSGIDALFVDEFDNFKNRRRDSKIYGLRYTNNSKRSAQIEVMLHYVRSRGGRTVGATATFVTNAIAETHTVAAQLAPHLLKEQGIVHIDDFASVFIAPDMRVESTVVGNALRVKERLRYTKTLALSQFWRRFIDYVPKSKLPYIPEPPLAPRPSDGKREAEIVVCPRMPEQDAYIDHLVERAERLEAGGVEPQDDNWLLLSHHARELALDPRLRGLEPSGPTKVDIAVDNALKIYKQYEGITYIDKATGEERPAPARLQAMFCDMSTPKEAWNVYDEATDRLVAGGVPRHRIWRMQDAKTEDAKAQAMLRLQNGDFDFVIGSTSTMGVGVNMQRWGIAEHHLDAPHRPRDMIQRYGRLPRNGNVFDQVHRFVYVTEGTRDAASWDLLTYKAEEIHKLQSGEITGEDIDDLDSPALSMEEIRAMATGNPLLVEKAQLNGELKQLQRQATAYNRRQGRLGRTVRELTAQASSRRREADELAQLIEQRVDTRGDEFAITLQGQRHTKRADAWQQLKSIVQHQLVRTAQNKPDTNLTTQVGQLGGFALMMTAGYERKRGAFVNLGLDVKYLHGTFLDLDNLADKDGGHTIVALEKQLRGLEAWRESALEGAERDIQDAELARQQLGQPFPHADRLNEVRTRMAEVEQELLDMAITDARADLDPGRMAEVLGAELAGRDYQHDPRRDLLAFTLGEGKAVHLQVRVSDDAERPFLVAAHGKACTSTRRELPRVVRYMAGGAFRGPLEPRQMADMHRRLIDDPGPAPAIEPSRQEADVRQALTQLNDEHQLGLSSSDVEWIAALTEAGDEKLWRVANVNHLDNFLSVYDSWLENHLADRYDDIPSETVKAAYFGPRSGTLRPRLAELLAPHTYRHLRGPDAPDNGPNPAYHAARERSASLPPLDETSFLATVLPPYQKPTEIVAGHNVLRQARGNLLAIYASPHLGPQEKSEPLTSLLRDLSQAIAEQPVPDRASHADLVEHLVQARRQAAELATMSTGPFALAARRMEQALARHGARVAAIARADSAEPVRVDRLLIPANETEPNDPQVVTVSDPLMLYAEPYPNLQAVTGAGRELAERSQRWQEARQRQDAPTPEMDALQQDVATLLTELRDGLGSASVTETGQRWIDASMRAAQLADTMTDPDEQQALRDLARASFQHASRWTAPVDQGHLHAQAFLSQEARRADTHQVVEAYDRWRDTSTWRDLSNIATAGPAASGPDDEHTVHMRHLHAAGTRLEQAMEGLRSCQDEPDPQPALEHATAAGEAAHAMVFLLGYVPNGYAHRPTIQTLMHAAYRHAAHLQASTTDARPPGDATPPVAASSAAHMAGAAVAAAFPRSATQQLTHAAQHADPHDHRTTQTGRPSTAHAVER
ncbi:UvrD-helicase domain-containing protein [Nonomuraea sp. NPDC003707]